MMALLIEVQHDYQPYCQQPQANAPTYDELLNKSKKSLQKLMIHF